MNAKKLHRLGKDVKRHPWVKSFIMALSPILLICAAAVQPASAGSWFTGRTFAEQTIPIQAETESGATVEALSDFFAQSIPGTTSVTPVAIDLTVSLEADPQGDDRLVWVQMMEHFADAIYEATNGAHKLGKIRIFRNSDRADNCDIFWKANTDMSKNRTPHVKNGGGVLSGGRINMYEFAVWSSGSTYNYLNDPENAGYTMAHEMGHYYYGLYDEYAVGISSTTEEVVSPSMMNSQWKASSLGSFTSDKRWLNFSIAAPSSGNPGDFQNTEKTEHHLKLGASAWEVLARNPSDDPSKSSQKKSERKGLWLGPRKHFSELAAAAPANGATPSIELPNDSTRSNLYLLNADGEAIDAVAKSADPCRDLLEVIWMEQEEVEAVIVIDASGSMGGTRIDQAKQASKLLVNQFALGTSSVAILAYDSSVSVVQPLTVLDDENDRQSVLSAIDTISAGGLTAIGAGAREALNLLLASRDGSETQVVFLLSDGQNTSGENPANVIPDYQNAQIPLFTFGFGSGSDESLMRQLADDTSGEYYFSPTTLAAISQVFQSAGQIASSQAGISSGSFDLGASSSISIPFVLDASISSTTVTYTYVGSASDTTVVLRDPSSNTIQPTDTATIGNEVQKIFVVDAPDAGEWEFEVVSTAAVSGTYSINANTDGLTYSLQLGTDDNRDVYYGLGANLILTANLIRETGIADASVQAEVVNLDTSSRFPIVLSDDGILPDLIADDGIYSGSFQPTEYGDHRLLVEASNPGGQASLTDLGTLAAPGPNGEKGVGSKYQQIADEFNRDGSFDFTVSPTLAVPSFLTMPFDQEVALVSDAVFTASAEGNPTPSLQWQVSSDAGQTWNDINDGAEYAGTTTNQLTVLGVALADYGNLYRAIATNTEGTDTSESAELRSQGVAPVLDLASSVGSHGSGIVRTTGIAVSSNVSWSATDDASWISLGTSSGSGNGFVTYTLTANNTGVNRTGTITVSGGGLSATYTITQRKIWYPGASLLPNDWRYYDWFKGFYPSDDGWIYHGRHGWQYVVGDSTSGLFLWDVGTNRWFWTSEFVYPWMYMYGPDANWLYFFEGGRPGSRWYRRGDNGELVSEADITNN